MSTDEQARLADYTPSEPSPDPDHSASDEVPEQPAWTPDSDVAATNECLNCGGHVSQDFARVLGDNQDRVHHCQYCVSGAEIQAGAAADPDYEHYHDRGVPKR